jgi:hypothetical protein
VTYDIRANGWCITGTHLAVATSPSAIPQENGDPIPGHFSYSSTNSPCVPDVTYTIPLSSLGASAGTQLFVAAHASIGMAVDLANLSVLEAALPAQATLTVTAPSPGAPAYFPAETLTNGGILDGAYAGWCVDAKDVIFPGQSYTVDVLSSYRPLPPSGFPDAAQFPLLNWVINQGFVGSVAGDGTPTTYGDVQLAIWTLLGQPLSSAGIGSSTPSHVDAIVTAARTEGPGFVPGCGQDVAVILHPVAPGCQVTVAQVRIEGMGVPCTTSFGSETAWTAGESFHGKNWATYFRYTVQ